MAKNSVKTNTAKASAALNADLTALKEDAQTLIGALGDDLDDKTQEAKKRLLEALEGGRGGLRQAEETLRQLGREGIDRKAN